MSASSFQNLTGFSLESVWIVNHLNGIGNIKIIAQITVLYLNIKKNGSLLELYNWLEHFGLLPFVHTGDTK